jgi:hypothetical protein
LIQGRWNYSDRGLLDITHLRFFTAESLKRLFTNCGFVYTEIKPIEVHPSEEDGQWLERMTDMFGQEKKKNWMAYQYLIKASKTVVSPDTPNSASYPAFKRALRRLEWGVDTESSGKEVISLFENKEVTVIDAARYLERDSVNPDEAAETLALLLMQSGFVSSDQVFTDTLFELLTANRGDRYESS